MNGWQGTPRSEEFRDKYDLELRRSVVSCTPRPKQESTQLFRHKKTWHCTSSNVVVVLNDFIWCLICVQVLVQGGFNRFLELGRNPSFSSVRFREGILAPENMRISLVIRQRLFDSGRVLSLYRMAVVLRLRQYKIAVSRSITAVYILVRICLNIVWLFGKQ